MPDSQPHGSENSTHALTLEPLGRRVVVINFALITEAQACRSHIHPILSREPSSPTTAHTVVLVAVAMLMRLVVVAAFACWPYVVEVFV